ncbi:MAG: VOC family protein [Myxococcota bacterium]|nr:VOC family protein [Myxococcota bacterium]
MSQVESLGIKRLEGLHYYVHDLERSRRFYTEKLDFAEIGRSSEALERAGRQRSVAFQAGDVVVVCSEPVGEGGRAWRWLRKHPDGVGTLFFEVEDLERCFRLLDGRGGTPIDEPRWHRYADGELGTFSITTPFGSSTFRFFERRGRTPLFDGFEPYPEPRGGRNRFGFGSIDHVTSNFETMAPTLLWLEHVMGFEPYWGITFHTEDVARGRQTGSGLRSKVMWDPRSGVKFANNEPLRPFFKNSQINVFAEDMRGDGIQHAALTVGDIVAAVRGLRERGVRFYPTPGTYYDMLPARLQALGVGRIDEDVEVLRELEILVDGKGPGQYLLQIFLQDSASTHGEREAGPFFYEIIQRKGDDGFGGGNFRALFESIERQQWSEGRVG